MNAITFGRAVPAFGRPAAEGFGKKGGAANRKIDTAKQDSPQDMAWVVLEAATDFKDDAAIEACRRVINANLNGKTASPSDLHIIGNYFQ
jgi:hypothetical protein